jgi:hypothetical protein
MERLLAPTLPTYSGAILAEITGRQVAEISSIPKNLALKITPTRLNRINLPDYQS